MTTQLLIHLPTDIAVRFRTAVPARQRSNFVRELLEKHLPDLDDQMYQLGLQAQRHDQLQPEELQEVDATVMDGLNPDETFDVAKLAALCRP